MTPDTAEIGAAVEEAARVRLAQHGRLLEVTAMRSSGRAYSRVHRFQLKFEGEIVDACLKLHRHRDPALRERCVAWAREEFGVLEALHPASRKARELSVVRPLAFLPQLPGILLEAHEGVVLNTLLGARRLAPRRARRFDELEAAYARLGVSLRELQELCTRDREVVRALAALSPLRFGREELLRQADETFERAMSLNGDVERAAAERLYHDAREAFRRSAPAEDALVAAHGDLTPVNVFVLGPKVTLFDFVNFHLGHPYEDVSRFVTYTCFLRKNPLSLGRRDVARLVDAFMDGYGLRGWRDDAVFGFFLQKSMYRTLGGGFRFVAKPWLSRTIYRRAMLRLFREWIREGMTVPSRVATMEVDG
jgi:aminoglycoside phosphotransferase (APT) family kinase protein